MEAEDPGCVSSTVLCTAVLSWLAISQPQQVLAALESHPAAASAWKLAELDGVSSQVLQLLGQGVADAVPLGHHLCLMWVACQLPERAEHIHKLVLAMLARRATTRAFSVSSSSTFQLLVMFVGVVTF